MKYIDLFCGIGSFHYSFKKLGWECVMSCDKNKDARNTYETNYNMKPLGDIYDIQLENIPAHDILCAGFPCQPFSNAGRRKGFEDNRGGLIFRVQEIVNYHNPKVLILENVAGLATHNKGKTLQDILSLFEKDYNLTYKILKCSNYGIPQMRKRLFIIGISKTTSGNVDEILNCEKFRKDVNLTHFFQKSFEKKYAYTIRCGGRQSPINDRHNWDGYIVNDQEYRLTIEDALKLQGFDVNFKLCGKLQSKWRQLGNTIPTIFTEMIGLNINDFFD